ncbi:UDP:flavonoid glycosyltransferase YjiC (YdhE family) [Palleronia aestuarii]|uniref:UDP:flavonoid glycosyltransferase YjiC (YdhE family) n=1 Tax=Palleronia aestuarii TaxID=568105 RepID=A0A2W7NZ90_9RHOB|nr:nucleotide disphospho-sugar-binding domain-containing protein [Palleronia aestuarii]PZX18546.1 UDP:flavonoid glycosyltransferase YjiC (YdhE family) [Palleronia aestuarii]
MNRPILLTTLGSLGDLFPILALARALRDRGETVRLLLLPDDARVAAEHGIDAIAFGPSSEEVTARLGMTRSEIAASVFRDPSEILRRASYPILAELTRAMLPHAEEARLVAGTALAMTGPLAAEKAGRPYVPLLLQPVMMHSALDPPRVRGLVPPMVPDPANAFSRGWNRIWLKVVRLAMLRRHGWAQNRVRRELGLPLSGAAPLFGHAVTPPLRLGLWDPVLAPAPDDVPDLAVTGAARLDQRGHVPPALQRFLDDGPPPLVVSLGSVAHELGGSGFWEKAVALARGAGLRAVLLSGEVPVAEADDLCAVPYVPHAMLFPRAAAILHHGGMGTLGQALHAGRPQLILPIGADQPDNAHRAEALGIARRIDDPGRASGALSDMLRPETARRAGEVAARLIPDGAARAAERLAAL